MKHSRYEKVSFRSVGIDEKCMSLIPVMIFAVPVNVTFVRS